MNELKVFQNSEFGELGVIEIAGKAYFPATKCAKVLGHENPQRAIRQHCKGVTEMVTPTEGGTQTIRYIPEGDLYRLIVSSRLPAAERFERWVFDDVLPTLRKAGGFMPDMSAIIAAAVKEVVKQAVPIMLELAAYQSEDIRERLSSGRFTPKKRMHRKGGCIIKKLPTEIRQEIEDIILEDKMTYVEISAYMLDEYGVSIGKSSIGRYAMYLMDMAGL